MIGRIWAIFGLLVLMGCEVPGSAPPVAPQVVHQQSATDMYSQVSVVGSVVRVALLRNAICRDVSPTTGVTTPWNVCGIIGVSDIKVTLTIQEVTMFAVTNNNGVAEFGLAMNEPPNNFDENTVASASINGTEIGRAGLSGLSNFAQWKERANARRAALVESQHAARRELSLHTVREIERVDSELAKLKPPLNELTALVFLSLVMQFNETIEHHPKDIAEILTAEEQAEVKRHLQNIEVNFNRIASSLHSGSKHPYSAPSNFDWNTPQPTNSAEAQAQRNREYQAESDRKNEAQAQRNKEHQAESARQDEKQRAETNERNRKEMAIEDCQRRCRVDVQVRSQKCNDDSNSCSNGCNGQSDCVQSCWKTKENCSDNASNEERRCEDECAHRY
jgi:hypothetical protein